MLFGLLVHHLPALEHLLQKSQRRAAWEGGRVGEAGLISAAGLRVCLLRGPADWGPVAKHTVPHEASPDNAAIYRAGVVRI